MCLAPVLQVGMSERRSGTGQNFCYLMARARDMRARVQERVELTLMTKPVSCVYSSPDIRAYLKAMCSPKQHLQNDIFSNNSNL